ncbi:MAG: aminoacyl-tRNA hydrolase [Phycisphaerae bacterium]|nr:aminoacyl-tRNA hydrolase [Phycisphaerae bacterium]
MKLLVGLGNPGRDYDRTRHNAGFMVVDRLARRHAPGQAARARFDGELVEAPIGPERCMLLKPLSYMNRSGPAVSEAAGFYKLDPARDVLVIVDDIYLPCGQIRLRDSGSAAGHNGLADVERALGTIAYPRLRVGVNAPPPQFNQADWVLSRFSAEEWSLVEPSLDRAADAAEEFVRSGISSAMNRFNAKSGPDPRGTGPGAPPPALGAPHVSRQTDPRSTPGAPPASSPRGMSS